MYRMSRQPLQQQRHQYEPQQWNQIIAHYEIQVQVQRQKLQRMQESQNRKIQQLERRIKQQAVERQYINANMSQKNQPLQMQIQSRKREIELLQMKLQQLKKSPQQHLSNRYSPIDQLLIPMVSPQIEIQEKQKQIRQLQNDLIQAENIFQGKYVIEHKLINEYEMELKMNKRLILQLDQKQNGQYKISNMKRNQQAAIVNQYKKLSENVQKQIPRLRQKIKQVQRENMFMKKNESQDQQVKKQTTRQPNLLLHGLSKIFNIKSQTTTSKNIYTNLNPQSQIKLQALEIQNLQSKLTSILEANQQLLKLKQQKEQQLAKIKMLNQQTEQQRKQSVLKSDKELKRDYNYVNERMEGVLMKERQNLIEIPQPKSETQPQSILQGVIKFFRGYNRQMQQKKQIEKQPISMEQKQQIIKQPIMSRLTLPETPIIEKDSSRLSQNQNLTHKKMQRQEESSSPLTYGTPQQNKYNRFNLQQIYKKNTPKTQVSRYLQN